MDAQQLIAQAHERIVRVKGRQYSPTADEIQQAIDEHLRLELVQDVLDRLVYLQGEELDNFVMYIGLLKDLYPINMVVKDGIRIYNIKK